MGVVIGFDPALPGSEMTTLFSGASMNLRVGDHVNFPEWPNRYRVRVVRSMGPNACEIKTFVRPSRGWARHVRRQKQMARR